jgi:hypothetical protein
MAMVNKVKYIGVVSALALLLSCDRPESPDCFKKAGEESVVLRYPGEFDRIHALEYLEISIVQDSICFVEVSGGKNLLEKVRSDVEAGVLILENRNTCDMVRNFERKPRVRVHLKQLKELQLFAGAGDIRSEGVLNCDGLFVECNHGNGDVDLSLNAEKAVFQFHTGSCDLKLNGTCQRLELYNQGYGYVDARNLLSLSTGANNSSVNEMVLYAQDYLFASINSKGNIVCYGQPDGLDVVRKGTGELILK